ncbi:MAG: hypothetical protein VW835_17020, partial [Rickettsiales bacterium]
PRANNRFCSEAVTLSYVGRIHNYFHDSSAQPLRLFGALSLGLRFPSAGLGDAIAGAAHFADGGIEKGIQSSLKRGRQPNQFGTRVLRIITFLDQAPPDRGLKILSGRMRAFDGLHISQRLGLADIAAGLPKSREEIPIDGRPEFGIVLEYLQPMAADIFRHAEVFFMLFAAILHADSNPGRSLQP